tara:strand:+ start:9816 stop:10745 length:930 start_codon:yes stop_codon:yes gene_type:complete
VISTLKNTGNNKWTNKDIPNLEGKVALVTGSNSGLGYYTAKALSQKGCHIILACRTLSKSNQTKYALEKLIPKAKLTPFELDLSDFKKVSDRTNLIFDNFNSLDLLINNAGIMHPPKTLNAQGYEIQFAVNHLSHMLLTLKLLPLIKEKNNSRIVTITSGAQFFGKGGWKNLKAENYYNKWESYAESKLANVMFALALHEKLKIKNISSLAAHPGIAKTNLFKAEKPKPNVLEELSLAIFSPFFQSAEMGSLPQLFAATSSKAKSGEHYGPKYNFRGYPKLSPTAPLATNIKERKILWEKSMEIIGEFI